MDSWATAHLKISASDKAAFSELAARQGLSTAAVLRMLVHQFVEAGGFPLAARTPLQIPQNLDWRVRACLHSAPRKSARC